MTSCILGRDIVRQIVSDFIDWRDRCEVAAVSTEWKRAVTYLQKCQIEKLLTPMAWLDFTKCLTNCLTFRPGTFDLTPWNDFIFNTIAEMKQMLISRNREQQNVYFAFYTALVKHSYGRGLFLKANDSMRALFSPECSIETRREMRKLGKNLYRHNSSARRFIKGVRDGAFPHVPTKRRMQLFAVFPFEEQSYPSVCGSCSHDCGADLLSRCLICRRIYCKKCFTQDCRAIYCNLCLNARQETPESRPWTHSLLFSKLRNERRRALTTRPRNEHARYV